MGLSTCTARSAPQESELRKNSLDTYSSLVAFPDKNRNCPVQDLERHNQPLPQALGQVPPVSCIFQALDCVQCTLEHLLSLSEMSNRGTCTAATDRQFSCFSVFSTCSFSLLKHLAVLGELQSMREVVGLPGKEQQPSHSTLTMTPVLNVEIVESVMGKGCDLFINTLSGIDWLQSPLTIGKRKKVLSRQDFIFWPTTPHRVYQMLHWSSQSQLAPKNLHHHHHSEKCVRRKGQQREAVIDQP